MGLAETNRSSCGLMPSSVGHHERACGPDYFGLDSRLRLTVSQAQRSDIGLWRGVTNNQLSQPSHLKHSSSSRKALATGAKSRLPKFSHSL
ncbi:hypothetical protein ABIB68_007247 [Bradyrhizobium sp. F1.2.2]